KVLTPRLKGLRAGTWTRALCFARRIASTEGGGGKQKVIHRAPRSSPCCRCSLGLAGRIRERDESPSVTPFSGNDRITQPEPCSLSNIPTESNRQAETHPQNLDIRAETQQVNLERAPLAARDQPVQPLTLHA